MKDLTVDEFEDKVGQMYHVDDLTLELVEASNQETFREAYEAELEKGLRTRLPFTLLFKAAKTRLLESNTYSLKSPNGSTLEVLLTPVFNPGGSPDHIYYQCIFA